MAGRSPGRNPSGSVPSILASFKGRSAEGSIPAAAMTRPYRSDSLTESGTANCPRPHSPSMHSGDSNPTSSRRPSPTNSPRCPSSFRIRDWMSGGAGLFPRWHFSGQITRLRSTTNNGRSPALAPSVAPESTSPRVASRSECTMPVYVLAAAQLRARSRSREAGDTACIHAACSRGGGLRPDDSRGRWPGCSRDHHAAEGPFRRAAPAPAFATSSGILIGTDVFVGSRWHSYISAASPQRAEPGRRTRGGRLLRDPMSR